MHRTMMVRSRSTSRLNVVTPRRYISVLNYFDFGYIFYSKSSQVPLQSELKADVITQHRHFSLG